MAVVETVRGSVPVDELGPTLMHEHVFVVNPEYIENYGRGSWWDEDERVADAIGKLRSLAGKGIRTLVDATVLGLGRDIPRIQRIAAAVPELNIVVATGVYTYHDVPFVYRGRGPGLMVDLATDPMVTDFVRDLTDGIADTGVKAAFLKCAVQEAMSPGIERICRAVARAHRETGAPITTHTNAQAQLGRATLEVFRSEGVDLTKVVIAHSGDTDDLDYLTEIADSGAILGMDRFGADLDAAGTAERVKTIAVLCARGYADRIVLSHDTCCFNDWLGPDASALRALLLPNWRYEYISDVVLPALRAAGVRDADIDQMMIENPRRYFTRS